MRKKSLLLILCMFILISLNTSCKENKKTISSYKDMNSLVYQTMLKEEGTYLIFIYGNNCVACEELEEYIVKYANLAINSDEYMPIYVINSSNERVNKGLIASDGDESYSDFRGSSNYKDIHISTTPALISVQDHKVYDYISTKVTQKPKTEIKEYFKSKLK